MCVALFLSALALVRAATPEEALAAEKAGDLAKALRLFTELAEAGDAAAAIDVGRFYFDGTGVARDYGKAMTWWVRAFEAGHGMAYNNIAVLYRDGLGVPKNLQIAWGLLYIGHMRGLGPQDAVSRMNRNMEKLVPQLTPEDVHEACRWSEEYFKAYVKNRGQNLAAIEELKLSRNHPPVLVLATF
jgi:hypothetical protein